MLAARPASIVLHPALSLNLQAGGSDGIGKLRQDHGCEPLRVAAAAFRLACETLGENRPQRVERPKVEPSQRQAGGEAGVVGNCHGINSIRAGWHGHPRVVGDDVHRNGEGKQGGSAVAKTPSAAWASNRATAMPVDAAALEAGRRRWH